MYKVYDLIIGDPTDLTKEHNSLGGSTSKQMALGHYKEELRKKHHVTIHPKQWMVMVYEMAETEKGKDKHVATLALPSLKKLTVKQMELNTIEVINTRMRQLASKAMSDGVTANEQMEYKKLERKLMYFMTKHKLIHGGR